MSDFPFSRTTCACKECVDCCKMQPGSLIPGDFEKIVAFLKITPQEAKAYFWASPGALALNRSTGIQFRIGTITPKLIKKRCVFLDENDRCRIHPVAPAGCAYFDTHMTAEAAQPRSNEMAWRQQDSEYQELRKQLPFATSYKPKGY